METVVGKPLRYYLPFLSKNAGMVLIFLLDAPTGTPSINWNLTELTEANF